MGQTYRFETQVWERIPEGLCVGGYRCSGKWTCGGWVGVGAAISECCDDASCIMPIPGVGIVLKNFGCSVGHSQMLAPECGRGESDAMLSRLVSFSGS